MPKSLSYSFIDSNADDEEAYQIPLPATNPPSPTLSRRTLTSHSTSNLRSHIPLRMALEDEPDEETSLLANNDAARRSYILSMSATPGAPASRAMSRRQSFAGSLRLSKHLNRTPSWSQRIVSGIATPT